MEEEKRENVEERRENVGEKKKENEVEEMSRLKIRKIGRDGGSLNRTKKRKVKRMKQKK